MRGPECVLAPFAGYSEGNVWNGNVAEDGGHIRTDGRFMFRVLQAVDVRDTLHRNPNRAKPPTEKLEELWVTATEKAAYEWDGRYDRAPGDDIEDRCRLVSDDGAEAFANRRYLALAARVLRPDRVTFEPADSRACPTVVFYRNGEPVGLLAQMNRPVSADA